MYFALLTLGEEFCFQHIIDPSGHGFGNPIFYFRPEWNDPRFMATNLSSDPLEFYT